MINFLPLSMTLIAALIISGCASTTTSTAPAPPISIDQLLGTMPARDTVEDVIGQQPPSGGEALKANVQRLG